MNKEMKMTVKKSEMILYCDNCGDKDRDFYEINDEGGKRILHLCKDCLMALLEAIINQRLTKQGNICVNIIFPNKYGVVVSIIIRKHRTDILMNTKSTKL